MALFPMILGGILACAVYVFITRRDDDDEEDDSSTNSIATPQEDCNTFVVKMVASNKSMLIFYGSQTGMAEGFANRLAKDASKYGVKSLVLDPEGCELDRLTELGLNIINPMVIFLVATYGEGDPTDNAQYLCEWLTRSQKLGLDLSNLNYSVFGLGNKTYENYNAFGKFVDQQMGMMGAQRISELGLGDDDGNIEDDFVTWSERFWSDVCFKFNITANMHQETQRQYLLTEFINEDEKPIYVGEQGQLGSFLRQKPPYCSKNPFLATILAKRELHKGGDRFCLHVEYDLTNSSMRYDAGDHLAVYPENDLELVAALANRLGLIDLDRVFSLENVDPTSAKRNPFPCPTTYGIALSHYLDITSPLRSNVLRDLAEFTEDENEKNLLRLLSSPTSEGRAMYASLILTCRRDLLTILNEMPNLKPPIDLICELLPRLQPRYYSISSSPKMHPTCVHITTVVIEYVTKTGRLAKGVCTHFLKSRKIGDKVPVFVRRTQFRLPFRTSSPVIMIGPGTGLAPFRGFIQDRWSSRRKTLTVGETVLYFGCRRRSEDFIYEDELDKWRKDGTLSQLHVAFSRDQAAKVYVQHLIRKNASDLWRLIDELHGHVYVCGDAKQMAADVYAALIDVFCHYGQMDKTAAVAYMKRLTKEGRYSADVWA